MHMKGTATSQQPPAQGLKARLDEAEATLRAIYRGEVDALVVHGPEGEQVYTLKGAETPYRLLLEAMNEGALTTSTDGTILYCNTRFAAMARRPMEQIVGSTCRPYFATEDYAAFQKLLKKAGAEGAKGEFVFKAVDGSSLPVEVSARGFELDGMEGFSILVSDVTELKRSSAKLQEVVGELEHFSYTITHDMRAPLRAMKGFGELLQRHYQDRVDGEGLDFIRRIIESAGRMDNLITDALNYTRVLRQQMDLKPVNAAGVLRSIVESYPQFQPPRAEVRIENDFPLVLANEAGMTQCFSNILGNAVKFVEPNKLPRVHVWAETRDHAVRFWFEDNGIGIPKRYHDLIFVMFQRLSKGYEGTGIGLALVRKTVERMKGKVGVESEVGQGSRFWIELQRCD
ncbi:MAG: hypothetical protein C5B50_03145 [Verrucomicrobia bacterium]|nr:MAG: hypothetical protein C5B50_03145 [Verrucomicrobiota bacterium]